MCCGHGHPEEENRLHWEGRVRRKHIRGPDTVEVAGSRLPDCTHACGSCSPCRLVMVSFVCASLAEAESCPMAYKCMCHNKSYPVP
ncbi:Protein EPIDERMAL PATTERNING FACTOR 1, partial [Mucuna pruriens]